MKNILYYFVKFWIKTGLFFYYGKITFSGLENVADARSTLFLPNHQSALMDALLLAVASNRKPYFLTRSDIFNNRFVTPVLHFFRMIPIYRIRDGRQNLIHNEAIFARCAQLLGKGESILMFPEANHSLKRRIRPLTKGFTRILRRTIEQQPDLDLRVVPVGMNYRNANCFPNRVHIKIGKNIPLNAWYDAKDPESSPHKIMNAVSEKLKTLTTDIPSIESYEVILRQLDELGVDYLNPEAVNRVIQNLRSNIKIKKAPQKTNFFSDFLKVLFWIVNFPVLVGWRAFIKPKVPEAEFLETFRFAYALLVYPLYYLSLFLVLSSQGTILFAVGCVLGIVIINWSYVRLA